MNTKAELMPVTAQQSQAVVTTPSDLLAMAVSQGADLDRLDKLMALQERWEANEARKAFVAAMAAFKAEPVEIIKSKAVGYETQAGDFVGYKHATTADVVDAVVPAMARHGLSHRWDVKQEGAAIHVTCSVTHRMGHSESVTMTAAPDNSGKKNAIQQVASTVQYLQRYTLMAIAGVAAKDSGDNDAQHADAALDEAAIKASDWIRQAEQIQEPQDYDPLLAKLKADYDNKMNAIPATVKAAFNQAKARVMPKDV